MSRRAHLAVALLWLGLVCLYTWPLARDPAHLWPENHDPRLFTWVMLSVFRNLLTRPAALFQGDAFYPVGNSLTFAEPLLTPALAAGSLHALTGNPVLAYNLTLLLFWGLSGWAMHAVAFRLTRDHAAALVAAAVFTLALYRTQLYVEFQLQIAFGLPLGLYALVRFLETQRTRHLLLFLLVFWLQAIAVWYYALILALGLAVTLAHYAALRWTGWRWGALARAAAGAAALGVALLPVAAPVFQTRRELGFERGLGDVDERSADVLTYLDRSSNWLYRAEPGGHTFESSLFPGAVALALAAAGLLLLRRRGPRPDPLGRALAGGSAGCLAVAALMAAGVVHRGRPFTGLVMAALLLGLACHAREGWRRRRDGRTERTLERRDWIGLVLAVAGWAFLFSLGPDVEVAGRSIGPGLYAWLYPYLLPLRAIRAVTRVGVLVLLAVALLAGFGVAGLRERLPRGAATPLVAAAIALLLLEYATFPLAYGRVDPGLRPVDVALRALPPDGVVLEWPTNVGDSDADAMFRALGHGHPVVNGYSGFVPRLLRHLSAALTTPGPPFPTPAAEAALRRIHPLRYLVVRLDDPALGRDWRPVWLGLRRGGSPLLRFRGSFGPDDLYEVVPLPERGARIERWIGYGLLARRPVLRLALRPAGTQPGGREWVEVDLNGRAVGRIPLDGPTAARLALPPPFTRVAPNVVTLRPGYAPVDTAADPAYRVGATGRVSPADLRVRSAGQPYGDRASIEVDGVEQAPGGRGYVVVALEPGGPVAARFDTSADPAASERLAAWIAARAPGTIVAGAVKDEASDHLGEAAVEALRSLGVAGDLRGRYRQSHAFVGVAGAAAGRALEAMGPRPVELVVGRPVEGLALELSDFALEPAAASR